MRKTKIRPIALQLWLSAIDPGLIRLRGAGRAALALLSIWLVQRTAVHLLFGGGGPPIPLYGVFSGIIFLLFINDLKPSDRRVSLALAPIFFTGAILLASLLGDYFWLNNLILLLMFFFAYFFRRYGARAGELALVATVGYYLGFLLHPPQTLIPLFLASIVVSAVVVYLWEFVIVPYDPARSLHQSIIAFYHNVALTVATIGQGLEAVQGNSQYKKLLQRKFRQVHQNRRVIEGLFAATVSPALWSQARLNRLQEEMYETERGLELLVEAAAQISEQLNEMPKDVLQSLNEGLIALEDQLWEIASKEGQTRLKEAGDRLQLQVKSTLEGKPPSAWVYSVLRMGLAARELADSVSAIHTIKMDWNESTIKETPIKLHAVSQSKRLDILGKKPGFVLHPTTILGLQAVLATGLSMLAAFLLDFDQPNLVYWTAFVVIAGSTGESLRRIIMRVMGVIAGTVVGVALAIIIPGNLILTVLLVTLCLFMTIYMIPASYAWMVFWLNIAVLLIITTLGGAAWELLYLRPVSTLLGATIAALVVILVLPIRVQNRFVAALSEFLQAIDRYLEVYITSLVSTSVSGDMKSEEVNIDLSYKKLELNLPNVIYEYNPLSRAQNRFANQATGLAALKSYVTRLSDEVGGEPGVLVDDKYVYLMQGIQSDIHVNIEALNSFLIQGQDDKLLSLNALGEQVNSETALKDILNAEAGSTDAIRNRVLYHLKHIYDTILQVASGLGAPVA